VTFGLILEITARIFNFKPVLTYRMAKVSGDGNYYSCSRAISELKLPQTPVSIALKESYEWLSSEK
jgi:dihydroflavonol-4-reductase